MEPYVAHLNAHDAFEQDDLAPQLESGFPGRQRPSAVDSPTHDRMRSVRQIFEELVELEIEFTRALVAVQGGLGTKKIGTPPWTDCQPEETTDQATERLWAFIQGCDSVWHRTVLACGGREESTCSVEGDAEAHNARANPSEQGIALLADRADQSKLVLLESFQDHLLPLRAKFESCEEIYARLNLALSRGAARADADERELNKKLETILADMQWVTS